MEAELSLQERLLNDEEGKWLGLSTMATLWEIISIISHEPPWMDPWMGRINPFLLFFGALWNNVFSICVRPYYIQKTWMEIGGFPCPGPRAAKVRPRCGQGAKILPKKARFARVIAVRCCWVWGLKVLGVWMFSVKAFSCFFIVFEVLGVGFRILVFTASGCQGSGWVVQRVVRTRSPTRAFQECQNDCVCP